MSNEKTRAAIKTPVHIDYSDEDTSILDADGNPISFQAIADALNSHANLEGERDALRKALEQYADKTNWRRRAGECTERWWSNDANGYEPAQAALRGPNVINE